ncbi:MAG: type II toxin-antitoxin system RelE/ParE family toxin [Acidihalobacter sp.]|uniref:type II toxin-antitoxin system RelE/ParE family toxin n=1 Tax=Acidihalobacter sp. TaxID=1872108 RepID=UPI00307FBB8E
MGHAQVRRHIATLKQCITRLATGQGALQALDALYPSLRMAHCEHHVVFCLPRGNTPALIVAILHERMDLVTRLADRLAP